VKHVRLSYVLAGLGLALAGASGFFVASATGGQAQQPRTVTVNVATGPQGPPGVASCPAGYTAGELVINHPGGQTRTWTCLHD